MQGKISGEIARHVSIGRLWDRLMALARFGALERGGVNRQALCDEEIPARAQLVALHSGFDSFNWT